MSDSNTPTTETPLFNNAWYDRLKYVALVLLPAFSALYFGLGQIWGFPKIEEVIGTVAVIDTVLGMLLRSSNNTYKKSDDRFDGSLIVSTEDGVPVRMDAQLKELENPMDLAYKEEVHFKVDQAPVVTEDSVPIKAAPRPRKRSPRKPSRTRGTEYSGE